MKLLAASTIIAYILSTLSIKYMLATETEGMLKKLVFYFVFSASLVLFTIYTYNLINNFEGRFNFIISLNLSFLIVNYLFFIFMFTKPIYHLGLVLFPLTFITVFITLIYDGATNIVPITNNNLKLHIISSIASYGFLGLAAIQAILLRYQEKKLKYVKESYFITMLPPIEKMEEVMFELIILGFILLTLSLLSGAPFVLSGTDQGLIQKILFSVIAWITYSFLIYKRFSSGVRGKRATNLTLSGMAFLFIAYLGTKLFFELF